ncbi:MAG: FAD:protein FMN transferase [Fuerstiella sp.]
MSGSSRRDFLGLRSNQSSSASEGSAALQVPVAGSTVHVATTAMACEFAVIMNAGSHEHVHSVSDALQVCADIESWLSSYRATSDLSKVNRDAKNGPVKVCAQLFQLMQQAVQLYDQTDNAFDMAAGSLIQLWKTCRQENRVPTEEEVRLAGKGSGSRFIELDEASLSVRLTSPTVQLDPGAIGKGYALDQARHWMTTLPDTPDDFLIHGGHSSLVAVGQHNDLGGWPVGIGNPLLTQKRLGTLLLKNAAMSTSGSNIQFFRHDGQRYGHILDPRTGWPVQDSLSVTVIAPSAMLADVLSTALFVLGAEKSISLVQQFPETGVILIPPPSKGTKIRPALYGVDPDSIFWDSDQVIL